MGFCQYAILQYTAQEQKQTLLLQAALNGLAAKHKPV